MGLRAFYDLSVRPRTVEEAVSLLRVAARLGVKGVAVESTVFEGDLGEVEREASRLGVRVFLRHTVSAATRREARRGIDSAPRNAIVVVEARSLEVLRYAAVNKRVDLIRPGPGLEAYATDRSQARLFRERGWGFVEVTLRPLTVRGLREDSWRRIHLMIRRGFGNGVSLVFVSDASEPGELWSPAGIAGIPVVAGIPEHAALSAVYNNPYRALARRYGASPG
ncbi:RNase P subunit p30 family protein [Stetteria hydrogenophila]